MKKIIIFPALILLIIIIVVITFLLFKNSSKNSVLPQPTPANVLTITPAFNSYVISTDPSNGAVNIVPNKQVVVTFSKQFTKDELIVAVSPKISYSTRMFGTNLIIKPDTSWEAGVPYRYTVKYPNENIPPESFTFTVEGPTPTLLPDTGPSQEEIESYEEHERDTYPDVFLAGKTPYEDNFFSVTSDFTKTPTDHFYFTVTMKGDNSEESKNDFLNWLKTFGFTDNQINSLDISYK